MFRAVITLAFLCLAPLAHADIAGQEDAGFVTARDAWLAGDDAVALPALAALAQGGNTAAQILLARIESELYTYTHITGDMDRDARIAFLRRSGGLSGKSWLRAAAKNEPSAQAYLDSAHTAKRADAVKTLLDYDEPILALIMLRRLVDNFRFEEAIPMLNHPALPADYSVTARYWFSQDNGDGSASRPTAAERALWTKLHPFSLGKDMWSRAKTLAALDGMAELDPLRALCATACPASTKLCTGVLWGLTEYSSAPVMTPSETLIADTVYKSSPRFSEDLKRIAKGVGRNIAMSDDLDRCSSDGSIRKSVFEAQLMRI